MNSSSILSVGIRSALQAITLALLVAPLAGCGDSGDDVSATAPAAPPAVTGSPTTADAAKAVAKDARMATAVPDGKTTAPVDLRYDILARPGLGQPFEVELVFTPRVAADSLDVEIGEATGLVFAGERSLRFAPVEAGETYTARLLLRGDNAGLYYVSLVAKVVTSVQTEARAFSIPVVIGSPPVAAKSQPQVDETGQAIESMPAKQE